MLKAALSIGCLLLIGYPVAWVLASRGVFGDVEFGYYSGFNVVRHAIESSQNVSLIEYGGVNPDISLEEFHFKVTCASGQIVRLWFDDSNMDVRQMCSGPAGILVWNWNDRDIQLYSIHRVAELLHNPDVSAVTVPYLVANIEELQQAVRTNDGDINDILKTDDYCWQYLRLDFPTQQDLAPFCYVEVKRWKELGWPWKSTAD